MAAPILNLPTLVPRRQTGCLPSEGYGLVSEDSVVIQPDMMWK